MHKASTSTKCCHLSDELPHNVKCFLPDICAELKELFARHRKAFTKRKRLLQLAIPKHRRVRYVPRCPCRFKKPIELIHLEKPTYTRTEQLSFPQVRKLLLFKSNYQHLFPDERLSIINRLIRYSLLSMYSRLQNIQPPVKPVPKVKWDKNDWKVHTKYLKKLAKHKTAIPLPKLPVNAMPLKKMKRFKTLAKPKVREEFIKSDWTLTPEIKAYKPSERVLKLATPPPRDDEALYQALPIKVTPAALKYKASERIKELATAPEKRLGESELKENPFSIAPNALKAKASARTQELAEPREFENAHIRENPNAISPAALKAKASPRIIELAKPKGS